MAKYEDKDNDGVRKDLLILAGLLMANSLENDVYEVKSNQDKLLDVTGSLGCWGTFNN